MILLLVHIETFVSVRLTNSRYLEAIIRGNAAMLQTMNEY